MLMKKKMVLCPYIPTRKRISKRKKVRIQRVQELSEDIQSNTTPIFCFVFSLLLFFYNPKGESIFNKGKRKFLMARIIMQTS